MAFMKNTNQIVAQFKESIFSTMTKLAIEHKAINLSQGFPDFDGPEWVKKLALNTIQAGKNQYAPSMGSLSLRQAVSKQYQSHYQLEYDANSEICITNGATEAIFCTIMALINPGDEVIILEPFYDSYLASIQMAHGVAIPVTLKSPSFELPLEAIKDAITSRTKLIIFNNPHNPTGTVFNEQQISELAKIICDHDLYLLSDEVYEHLTFGQKHFPSASIKELKERTITISSTGKTFGLTGWKIGWACAPSHILKAIHHVHQFTTFCVSHPLQEAMAEALEQSNHYLEEFKKTYLAKKNLLIGGLEKAGFDIIKPQGTYFVLAKIPNKYDNDIEFCKYLIQEHKVAAIPPSAFYLKSNEGERLVRFCFAKKDETLNAAIDHLLKKPIF